MRRRRGTALTLILALYLAVGALLAGAVSLTGASLGAGEREYRRSQALALAEAGIAEARAGRSPHEARPLGAGTYAWTEAASGSGRVITARGEVASASGARITRTVRAMLVPAGDGWQVRAWEEGP